MGEFQVNVPTFSPTTLSELESYFDNLAFELTTSISVNLDERAKLHAVEKLWKERRAKKAALVHTSRPHFDTKIDPYDKFILETSEVFAHIDIPDQLSRVFAYASAQTESEKTHDVDIQCAMPMPKTREHLELEKQLNSTFSENSSILKKYADIHNEFANYRKRSMRDEAEAAQRLSDETEKIATLQSRIAAIDLEKQSLLASHAALEQKVNLALSQRDAAIAKADAITKQRAPDAAELELAILRGSLKTAQETDALRRQVVAQFHAKYERQNDALRKALLNVRNKLNT